MRIRRKSSPKVCRAPALLIDTTGDGFADARIEDSTGDGKLDMVVFFTNGMKEVPAAHEAIDVTVIRGPDGFGLGLSDTVSEDDPDHCDKGRVTRLVPGGAAAQAGVMMFDKVVGINGISVSCSADVPPKMAGISEIKLWLQRPLTTEAAASSPETLKRLQAVIEAQRARIAQLEADNRTLRSAPAQTGVPNGKHGPLAASEPAAAEESSVLMPFRTVTKSLCDEARERTRSQLESALGAVRVLERELLADPLESEVSAVTGANVGAAVWARLRVLARAQALLHEATSTDSVNEVPLSTLNLDLADLWKSYLPLALALHQKREAHAEAQRRRVEADATGATAAEAFVVGINAPPGCGKSTLVQLLRVLLRAAASTDEAAASLVVAHVSSDDLYMTQAQRRAAGIGAPSPGASSRLDVRSIDGELAESVLWALKQSGEASEVRIPRFNKGLDEREEEKLWTEQRGKVDVVLRRRVPRRPPLRQRTALHSQQRIVRDPLALGGAPNSTGRAPSCSGAARATSAAPPSRRYEGWRVGVDHPSYARFNAAIDCLVCLDADADAIREWKVQSSRRDALAAGKPFDEAAIRRAFDEQIMPFVEIYERPLLARQAVETARGYRGRLRPRAALHTPKEPSSHGACLLRRSRRL